MCYENIYANAFKFRREKKCFAGESQLKPQVFPIASDRQVDAQYGVSTMRGTLWYFDWLSVDF